MRQAAPRRAFGCDGKPVDLPATRLKPALWGSPTNAAALWKSEIARDAMPMDARGSRDAVSAGGKNHPCRRSADPRISAIESERGNSNLGRWRPGAVGIDGDQSLSRAEIRRPDALRRPGRAGPRCAVERLGDAGDRRAVAPFAGAPRIACGICARSFRDRADRIAAEEAAGRAERRAGPTRLSGGQQLYGRRPQRRGHPHVGKNGANGFVGLPGADTMAGCQPGPPRLCALARSNAPQMTATI